MPLELHFQQPARSESRRTPWNGNPAAFLDPVAGFRGPSDSRVQLEGPLGQRLIPRPIDQNWCAHWRNPMDMMRQG